MDRSVRQLYGLSPIHFIARYGEAEILKVLVQYSNNLESTSQMFDDNVPKDRQGKTPLELACMSVSGDPLGAAKILASLTGYPTPKSRQDLIDIRIGITRKLIVP